MKIPFIIYAQALGIYLVLTLPSIVVSAVYIMSAMYAFCAGFAALVAFTAIFLALHLIKPGPAAATATLAVAVVTAVAVAYKLLLKVEMPERSFWYVDGFSLFPLAAVASGFISLAVNYSKIAKHFSPPVIEEFETIFSS